MSSRLLARAKYGFTALPTHRNPYLEYILTGTFRRARPRYLEAARFASVRQGLHRIRTLQGPIEAVAKTFGDRGFDGFNLSDVFEYMDLAQQEATYRALLEVARPGARLAYWNMLAPRRRPESLADRVQSLDIEAEALFRKDLAFFYSAFILEALP